jgi:hypothetical protein
MNIGCFYNTVFKRMFKRKIAIQKLFIYALRKGIPYFKFISTGELILNDAI